jgi:hypothetical protein
MEQPVRSKLNVKDLCELIRISGEAGVKELHFGEVRVIFKEEKALVTEIPTTIGISPANNVRELERSEQDIREDQLSMALLENPAEYERLLAAGELEDAKEKH